MKCQCKRCGRDLTDPKSVERGFGAVCYSKVNRADMVEQDDYSDRQLDWRIYPLDEGVWTRRHGGFETETNVPHLATKHSPTGFEWGYGGSGPADFALNIVEYYVRSAIEPSLRGPKQQVWGGEMVHELSLNIYQDFKWYFIAPMPRAGGHIPANEIVNWIKLRAGKSILL